ncbi:MAG TPA: hypothetical protein VJI96_00870 [Candidatus Andersenbacteria bacterium]|nr:hypothetical protein [Candidatus Andersenbacteria bacterium]
MKSIVLLFLLVIFVLVFFWWKSDFALPLFCTTRGCVTTTGLEQERAYQQLFTTATNSTPPSEAAILTTLVRLFLIKNIPGTTVSPQDAQKYREDVLHLTDPSSVQQIGFASFDEYDNAATIPFLLQQSYMNKHGFKSPREAFTAISQNISVISLLFDYTWDSSKGEVAARD